MRKPWIHMAVTVALVAALAGCGQRPAPSKPDAPMPGHKVDKTPARAPEQVPAKGPKYVGKTY